MPLLAVGIIEGLGTPDFLCHTPFFGVPRLEEAWVVKSAIVATPVNAAWMGKFIISVIWWE